MNKQYRRVGNRIYFKNAWESKWKFVEEPSKTMHAKCVHCKKGATITRERFEEDGQEGRSNEPYGRHYNGYICDKCRDIMDKRILQGLSLHAKETNRMPLIINIALKDIKNENDQKKFRGNSRYN